MLDELVDVEPGLLPPALLGVEHGDRMDDLRVAGVDPMRLEQRDLALDVGLGTKAATIRLFSCLSYSQSVPN